MEEKKLFVIARYKFKGTSIPVFYYTFAKDKEEAIHKVTLKWGEIDPNTVARELSEKEIENLVIATDYYG